MSQTLSFVQQTTLVCPKSPVHRPLKLNLNEKENQILIFLERMLGDKRKTGANASLEARPKTCYQQEISLKRIENPKQGKEPLSNGKTSMMEFLHKKVSKRSF